MKNNIIQEIWEIRGLVDKAIDTENMEFYNRACERYRLLIENEEYNKTFATATINASYANVEALNWDRGNNMAMITFDLHRIKSVLNGAELEDKEIQLSSVLDIIWYTRHMYDLFVYNSKQGKKTFEANKVIFESMVQNLNNLYEYYGMFTDKVSLSERETLKKLYEKVIDKHYTIYRDEEYLVNLQLQEIME